MAQTQQRLKSHKSQAGTTGRKSKTSSSKNYQRKNDVYDGRVYVYDENADLIEIRESDKDSAWYGRGLFIGIGLLLGSMWWSMTFALIGVIVFLGLVLYIHH